MHLAAWLEDPARMLGPFLLHQERLEPSYCKLGNLNADFYDLKRLTFYSLSLRPET